MHSTTLFIKFLPYTDFHIDIFCIKLYFTLMNKSNVHNMAFHTSVTDSTLNWTV